MPFYIIMQQKGFPYLQNYIDDLIYIGLPSSVAQSYQSLLELLQELGLEISRKKKSIYWFPLPIKLPVVI